MNKSIGLFVVSLFCLGACDIEHYDDCRDEDGFDFEDDFEAGPRAGTSARAGSAPSGEDGGSNGNGGSSGSPPTVAGTGGTTEPEPEPEPEPVTPCEKENDCGPGFNCNLDVNECQPADAETCGELESEAACADRSDCIPIYGGLNCSCGADCECQGGDPGCVCETFDYVVCRPTE
jgi:hypothetical protein